MKSDGFKIWEGVYEKWSDAPADDGVFDGDIWVQKITERAKKAHQDYLSSGTISSATLSHDYVLQWSRQWRAERIS